MHLLVAKALPGLRVGGFVEAEVMVSCDNWESRGKIKRKKKAEGKRKEGRKRGGVLLTNLVFVVERIEEIHKTLHITWSPHIREITRVEKNIALGEEEEGEEEE